MPTMLSVTFVKVPTQTNVQLYMYQKYLHKQIFEYDQSTKFNISECPNRYSYKNLHEDSNIFDYLSHSAAMMMKRKN